MTIRWKHLLALVIVVPVLGLLFGWSGLMSIRASSGHWAVTDWFLHWVMGNSVRTAAFSIEVPPLDNPALLPPAAGHYETGCAICHGSPAQGRSQAALAMLPPPPDLKTVVPRWTDAQLFEIVKHGVRFTGMPAWPAQTRHDEVWAMIAFLRKLPDMDEKTYARASGLHGMGTAGEVSPLSITCESCHAEAKLNDQSIIPRLSGQSEVYLLEALKAYRVGKRPSGFMQVPVATLPTESLQELARYYATQRASPREVSAADAQLLEAGAQLAKSGRSADKIPPCLSCHDRSGANPAYPKLAGQNSAYLSRQLELFRQGIRGGGTAQHLMVSVAKNMSDADIEALSAFFSRRR
jgi:cytochrome c553